MGSAGAEAQGLGAAAQKEKEKRAAKGNQEKPGAGAPEAKVYTGDDLAAYGGSESGSPGSGDASGSLSARDKAARAAYNAAMEDWLAAGKDKAALGPRPTGRDRSAQDQWDRRNRDAERRYREAQEAIAAARQNVEALEEEARRQQPPSGETPGIRLPLKADGEMGPGISPQERTWRDQVASARAAVAKAEENLEAAEKAQAALGSEGARRATEPGVVAARDELRKAEAYLKKSIELARQQGFDLR